MRRIVVGHEFSDQFSIRDQRKERDRANSFSSDCRLQGIGNIGNVNVADTDRFGVLGIRFPWGMTLQCSPVIFGQAAPIDETHHALAIEKQNRRTITEQSGQNGIECGGVNIGRALRLVPPLDELIERFVLPCRVRERLLRRFTFPQIDDGSLIKKRSILPRRSARTAGKLNGNGIAVSVLQAQFSFYPAFGRSAATQMTEK